MTGFDVRDLCWGRESFQLKNNPLFVHLVLFVISGALLKALLEKGYKPSVMVGHSLGEVLAVLWGGAFSVEDSLYLIKRRGELFLQEKEQNKSDMVALIGEEEQLLECIRSLQEKFEVYVANYNSKKQIVVSYRKEDYCNIIEIISKSGIKSVFLNIGNGCHSPFLRNIDRSFSEEVEKLFVRKLDYTVYSVSFNSFYSEENLIKEYLKKHMLAPVYWQNAISNICESYKKEFVILGFSKVMKGLIIENIPAAKVVYASNLLKENSINKEV
ncbi:hypothetical protein BREVNS_1531 [Brevinematales bacterium NS]|nr:hypothetical protein BREVNS_1531 [Brevinematales bacterium NS]